MKTKITFLAITFALIGLSASAQSWQWAKSAGGANNEYGQSICTDANNNVLATGIFQTPTIAFGTTTLTNAGNGADIFVVKYDPAGNVLWAKSIGGINSHDHGLGIATDPSGNVVITGGFQSPTLTIGTATLTNSGNWDIFIAKYDASGNFLWAKSSGGFFSDMGQSVSTDASGNVLLTGHFSSSTIAFGTTTLTNSGSGYDIYLVKFDASGNTLWATSAAGTSFDYGQGVSTDAAGNVVLTGFFQSPTLAFGTNSLTFSGSGYDLFVAKYNASGTALWAVSAGGNGAEYGQSISTDASGNILITGSFGSSTLNVGGTTLTNAGSANILVVKYDAAGNVLWAKSAAGSFDDVGYGISADAGGNVYVTGGFQSSTISWGTTTLTNVNSGSDIFITKFNASGSVVWAQSISGSAVQYGQSIATDLAGNVLLTGYFDSSTLSFGTTTLTNNGGSNDLFISKYSQCTAPASPTNITSAANQNICSNNSTTLAATSSGSVSWYATPSSTTAIGFGNNFITPTLTAGTYTYYAEASTCTVSASRTAITVTVNPTPSVSMAGGAVCPGNSFTLIPNGANTYTYSSGSAIVSPTVTTSYSVSGSSSAGCISNLAVATVTVTNNLTVTISGSTLACFGQPVNLTAGGASTYTWNNGVASSTIAPTPTANTSYSVIGASGTCSSTAAVSVSVNPSPVVSAVTNNTMLCTGQSATLTASGASSYTWNTNATNASIVVSPTVNSTYTVTGANSFGCFNSTAITQSVSVCTSVQAIKKADSFIIYPNPTTGRFTVATDKEVKISVYNSIGSEIYNQILREGETEVDISLQSKGVYLIKVGSVVKRVIKE